MTRNDIVLDQLLELINHHGGIDAINQAVGVLMNHAMIIERAEALGAEPYQRTERRRGHANGFKPKTLRIGFADHGLEARATSASFR